MAEYEHPEQYHQHKDELVLSYHRVRNALGILGLMLPILLIIGGLSADGRIEPSISDFFHTKLRDIFVGIMTAIGVFLVSYRGYQKAKGEWFSDDIIATTAGIAAFFVAFFPNETGGTSIDTVTQAALGLKISPIFHYVSASVLYLCLAGFCYVKFPKTAKPFRRKIYFICGHVILLSWIGIFVASYFKMADGGGAKDLVESYKLVFWFEAIGIWAFAISWLVKGKADMALARR